MRLASFLPFQATYYLNGHSFIEQELKKAQVAFRKNDNAFLAIDDVAPLQAAADRLSPQIIQKQLDYWTLILGPKFSRAERNQINLSRFYAIGQIEYCRNFIFKRNFPIHKIFERSCEIGLWRLTANRISELFGVRLHKRLGGKLGTVIDQIEHGHHVFRAYWKNAFLKQYEKFCTLLRNELCSNNLSDFALKKGLQNLNAVRTKFLAITDRFARLQAQWLNVHVDFPLLQRMALPITTGSVYYAGIKIHETRIIRLLEVLLHAGNNLGGWSAKHIHQVILQSFQLSEKAYGLNQLRYDLRKLKGHSLLERDGSLHRKSVTTSSAHCSGCFFTRPPGFTGASMNRVACNFGKRAEPHRTGFSSRCGEAFSYDNFGFGLCEISARYRRSPRGDDSRPDGPNTWRYNPGASSSGGQAPFGPHLHERLRNCLCPEF